MPARYMTPNGVRKPRMAGETAHFNLRNREPTPAVRPFDVPPRLKAMLDGAHAALAEPFQGIAEGSEIVPGLFAPERTGVSLGSLLEAARSFLAANFSKLATRVSRCRVMSLATRSAKLCRTNCHARSPAVCFGSATAWRSATRARSITATT